MANVDPWIEPRAMVGGFVLVLWLTGCRDPMRMDRPGETSSSGTSGSAQATGTDAIEKARTTATSSDSTITVPSERRPGGPTPARVDLPSPPKPPEFRDAAERTDAPRILAGYGFPTHDSLTPLCGWRDFSPEGTTWVTDAFASNASIAALRQSYEKRLGTRGLRDDTWSIPAEGVVQRQLLLEPPSQFERQRRCSARPPVGTKAIVVARRAQ